MNKKELENMEALKGLDRFTEETQVERMKELVELVKMLLPENRRFEKELTIDVGKRTGSGFQTYLKARARQPFVIVSEYGGEPMVTVKDLDIQTLCAINLKLVQDIEISAEGADDEKCGFVRHNAYFKYNNIEYKFCLIVNKAL